MYCFCKERGLWVWARELCTGLNGQGVYQSEQAVCITDTDRHPLHRMTVSFTFPASTACGWCESVVGIHLATYHWMQEHPGASIGRSLYVHGWLYHSRHRLGMEATDSCLKKIDS
jgi:hypothetical protein